MAHDIVLLGATGFTGGLTADYLGAHVPDGATWAVAGRSRAKLEAVAQRVADAGGAVPQIEVADITDTRQVRALAESTRVLATTVGPYVEHGEPAVAACAHAGTAYCDLTGEPEFVDRTWLAHHRRAEQTGARLVHACGFDSVPHDLGVQQTVALLPDDVPLTVRGFVTANADFSGGTYHSAVRAFSRVRQSGRVAAERRKTEGRAPGRRVRALPARPERGPGGQGWALPLPTIDPVIVRRSARALPAYGPDFSYGHYALFGGLPMMAASAAGAGAVLAVSQLPPGRDLLLKVRSQGEGPSQAKRDRSWFKVRFVAEGGGETVTTEVSGGDPGYTETARMLGESALCLALDDLPDVAGQVTTAVAMGDALSSRLDFFRRV
ncbi:saccharopine dehydrogenase family protein [Solicola sp. PLA-1-18]|uniref:saccharopine dehydrogenase family protein n=1 Tax=Solicola sp. PLA-1-18 TaxID=3380532 RepID=UPI003B7AC2D8